MPYKPNNLIFLKFIMIIVLSPAKSLNFTNHALLVKELALTSPEFFDDANYLAKHLSQFSSSELSKLMNISMKLAELNYATFQNWQQKFDLTESRQALLAFDGDVYTGLQAATLSNSSLQFAQKHLRILSGIYGVLKPFDQIQAYRLEMGLNIKIDNFSSLYDFWQKKVSYFLNQTIKNLLGENQSPILINLASNEYFKAINLKQLNASVITPVFEDFKGNDFKIISFYAKRARGLMARYILENKIVEPNYIKEFSKEGYCFDSAASTKLRWVFRRHIN